ncbi:MAG: APC family permease [Planctomycetaceae bacterium]|nr:APC family permease [Planctomycetaceae bacterium]
MDALPQDKRVTNVESDASPADAQIVPRTESSHAVLQRRLGLPTAVAVVVGTVIGSGIFFKPGQIAGDAGSFPLIFSVWIFGGIVCILGALCFAELGTMFPHAGGLYIYLREAYGRPVAFLFGWSEFAFGKPASIGALSVAFVGALFNAAGRKTVAANEVSHMLQDVGLVFVLVTGLAWINIRGVHWGAGVAFAITLVKIVFVGLVSLIPFALTLAGHDAVHASNYSSTITPLQPTFWTQATAALLAVSWAYHGWHGLTPLGEEIRDPQRNLPRGLLWGVGIVMALYLGANLAYHGAMTMGQMAAAKNDAAQQMLTNLLGQSGSAAMAVVIVCSTFGAINANLLEAPRISFAMGRDRVFFRQLGQVHSNYGTPSIAIATTAAMALLAVTLVAVVKMGAGKVDASNITWNFGRQLMVSVQQGTIFGLLTNFVVFSSTVFFVLCVLAVFILRFTRPGIPRPYRTWGYPWVPLAFLLINIPFLFATWTSNPAEALAGLAVLAVGLPVYFLFFARNAGVPQRES